MRHPLNLLLRIGRSPEDAAALRGDLEEAYRDRVRPTRSWLRAQGWYLKQLVVAAAHGARDGWRRPSLRAIFYPADVRFALRRWRRRPGFAVTAILTLGLGIGATTAIFSVVDAVILRPLPYPEAERLVIIYGVYPERRQNPTYATTWNRGTLTCPMWDAVQDVSSFESVAVWTWGPSQDITFGEARTEIVSVGSISSEFLPLLGVEVIHGRNFNRDDDVKPTYSMLLPYETWQRRFGGQPDIIGQTVTMGHATSGGQHSRTVVGVLAPGLAFDGAVPEFLWNVGTAGEVCRTYDGGSFRAVARMSPAVTLESATAEAAAVMGALQRREQTSVRLVSLVDEHLGGASRPLWLLFAGAGMLLLVACSNVAGLLLGEGRARRHEVGVRVALGGSRLRLIRQLVVEHSLLAVAGSTAGLLLAVWMTQGLVGLAPPDVPRIDAVTVDLRAAAFALAAGFVTLLVFGVGPALSLARTPAAQVIAEGSREAAGGRHLGHRVTVAVDIALALVLLVGAALFGETILRLTSQPLGFNPANLAIVSTTFTGSRFGDPVAFREARRQMTSGGDRHAMARLMSSVAAARTDRVIERLAAVPGVVRIAATATLPFVTGLFPTDISAEGSAKPMPARSAVVDEAYFDVLQIPVIQGRGFDGTDLPGGPLVAVVSEDFGRRFFDGRSVGQRFVRTGSSPVTFGVVGVVADVKQRQLVEDAQPVYYALNRQVGETGHFVARTAVDPASVLASLRNAIAEVDPQIVVTRSTTMTELMRQTVAEERFRAMLSICFGAAALVLAAVGLYGLAARRVADRRRELGVRVALGAAPANLRRLVLRDAGTIVGVGLLVGLPAAFATSHLTRTFLFGVSPTSPHVFATAAAVLGLTALIAMLGPARRAAHVDPVLALKE